MQLLEVTKVEDGRKVTVTPRGVINTATISALADVLDSLDYQELDLTLDFSGLQYMTSVGLRALLVARKKLTENSMRVIHMNQAIREVMEVSGFLHFIPVVPDPEDTAMPEDPSYKQLFAWRAKTSPDHRVFFMDDRSISWREIDEASQIVAADLDRLGVRKGTHVGMFARNTLNWVIAFFAAQKLGAIVVLLNYSLKPDDLKMYSRTGDITHLCFDRASAKMDSDAFRSAVIGPDSCFAALYDISGDIDFLARREAELDRVKGLFTQEFDADDPSIMIFTSGSTGRPKGVLSSTHDRLVNNNLMNQGIKPTSEDKGCLFLPLCHVFGLGSGLHSALLYNMPVYMPSDTSDESLLKTIEQNGITLFNSVPTKILSMVGSPGFAPERVATLRASVIAGSAITEPQMLLLREKMPGNHFVCIYGMSEMSPISVTDYDDTVEHITRTVGRPVEGVIVEIRDHTTGEVRPAGAEGEIFVKSKTALICYYKMDLDLQAINADGWIPTGDLGLLDEEGYLHITGRCKDLIIRGGENIAPKEIEEVITELEEIRDVKAVGVPDEIYGEIIGAAVIMAPGCAFSREKTEAHILSRLARYKAPAYYVLYESFPLLANGKVDMVTLKKDVASRRGTEAAL